MQYVQVGIAKKQRHAVKTRAGTVHKEYLRKLHEVDKIAGTTCPGRRLRSGKCSYGDDIKHTEGGGEKYLTREFGTVQPLVFGHFGELTSGSRGSRTAPRGASRICTTGSTAGRTRRRA